jgi:hypothetical protein
LALHDAISIRTTKKGRISNEIAAWLFQYLRRMVDGKSKTFLLRSPIADLEKHGRNPKRLRQRRDSSFYAAEGKLGQADPSRPVNTPTSATKYTSTGEPGGVSPISFGTLFAHRH